MPDVFQIIVKEKGVFSNVTSPSTKAKLRILFEVAPLGLLVSPVLCLGNDVPPLHAPCECMWHAVDGICVPPRTSDDEKGLKPHHHRWGTLLYNPVIIWRGHPPLHEKYINGRRGAPHHDGRRVCCSRLS